MPTAELPTPTPLPGRLSSLPVREEQKQWGQTFWQLIRFGLVGCVNTLVDLLALNCLLWLLPVQNAFLLLLANSLAYALGALNSFLLNRYWTFQCRGRARRREVTRFVLTTLASIVCNDLILYTLNSVRHPEQFSSTLWTNVTKVVAIGGTVLISYLGMRLWVFVQSSHEVPEQARHASSARPERRDAARTAMQEPAHGFRGIGASQQRISQSLSLVLPAYNEEQIIAATVEHVLTVLAEQINDFEVIVVNDGSSDRTGAILARLSASDPRIRVITHEHNQGYGATLADGFAAASKELTFFMDSDGQFDIQDLGLFFPFINAYDAVIGYRIRRQDTWMRKLNAWGWKQVVRVALGVRVRDIDCAFKLLRTAFLHAYPLETRGAMINAELLYKLKRAGCTCKEIGVRHLPRQGGRATGANLRVIGRAFRELFLYARIWRQTALLPQLSPAPIEGVSTGHSFQEAYTMLETETTSASSESATHYKRQHIAMSFPQRLALAAVMLTSIFMNFYQLGQHGFGNLFYAAGVRSMSDSLHNFFFVSYDPGGFVTVDKPPLGFWLQTLSVKLFGFTPFSIFLPQALAGVLAVLLLFYLVYRHFGFAAGLLAALALACSPLSVATARNNTIDSTLVLVLLAAAWAMMRAAETGRWRWLLLSAGLVGLGFNVKMMEAYLVVPAFGLLYLLAAPRTLWLRIGQLLVAALVLLAVSLSWATVVDLTPATQRPYVGSSQNNSEISLAFGYNGVDRLLGRFGFGGNHGETGARNPTASHTPSPVTSNLIADASQNTNSNPGQRGGGHGFDSDSPGPLRLFNQALGGQISWLLPFALFGLLALAWQRRPRFQQDHQQQSLLLWGAWLLTMGAFFSIASFFHSYYMTTFAPAICALFGIGAIVMWQDYQRSGWRGWLLPSALVATAAEQIHFIVSNPAWGSWLIPLIALPCVLSALALGAARLVARHSLNSRVFLPILGAGLAALLLTPAIWSAMPALQNAAISTPSAGPERSEGFGGFARNNATANPALIRYLQKNQGQATYLAATPSSMSANALILATNQPVMAMGGFAGRDPILTTSQLSTLVASGTVRFFLLNNPSLHSSPFGRGRVIGAAQDRATGAFWFGNSQTALTNWVTQRCAKVPASQWQPTTPATQNSSLLLYDCAPDK